MMNNDKLVIGGHEFNSRFILGSGKYAVSKHSAAKNLVNSVHDSIRCGYDPAFAVRSSISRTFGCTDRSAHS